MCVAKNNQRSQYALVLDSDVCGKNNQRSQYALVLDSDVCVVRIWVISVHSMH